MRLGDVELEVGDELNIWIRARDGTPNRRHPYTGRIVRFGECQCAEVHPVLEVVEDTSWGELVCGDYVINSIRRKIRGP